MRAQLRPAVVSLCLFTALCGFVYPLAVTGIARVLFPWRASGSLVERDGRILGSALIGQPFVDPGYFRGRPSATQPVPYNGAASSGSNLGPLNPDLAEAVRARVAALRASDPGNPAPIPVDLVTASGSGLDPHISPAAAYWQAHRVARARGIPEAEVRRLIEEHLEGRTLGFLGEPRVNVLLLNLALDKVARTAR